jgi:hypothetical protein
MHIAVVMTLPPPFPVSAHATSMPLCYRGQALLGKPAGAPGGDVWKLKAARHPPFRGLLNRAHGG